MVVDTRPDRPQMMYPFNGIQREIYDFCDEIRTRGSILDLVDRSAAARSDHRSRARPVSGQMLDSS